MSTFVIEKLRANHELAQFDCGKEELNRFLTRFALTNQQAQNAQTYVACRAGQAAVVGYYSLAFGSVAHEQTPERIKKGLARHPIPVMILSRLAIDQGAQCQGLGQGLLKDALERTMRAADIGGLRAVLVHAKDDAARAFYQHFNFEPSPTDPYHLFVLTKDLKRIIG
jgi:GNAT superfamily N-acetyltransferase